MLRSEVQIRIPLTKIGPRLPSLNQEPMLASASNRLFGFVF